MRVLHITNFFPPYRMGGAEVAAYNSCLGMRRRGFECAVLCIHAQQPAVERQYRISGIPVRQVFRRERVQWAWRDVFSPWVYRRVKDEIRRFKPDVVHTHNVSGMSLAPFVASQHAGVPVVATLHDHWLLCPNNMLYQQDASPCDPTYPVSRGQCGRCFREYDFWGNIPYRRSVFAKLTRCVRVFFVASQYLLELHLRAGYDRERFQLLRLGVPMGEPLPLRVSSRSRDVLNEVGRRRTLLFAGGLNIIKGAQVLIDALPDCVRHVPGFRLIVAGREVPAFTTQLRKFDRSVHLLGQVPFQEMRLLYAAADLTAVPSTCRETFSLVAAESMAMGTPVVGSAHGGTKEIVRDRETGYLIPPGDPQALAERVIEHFDRPAIFRRQMRHRCAHWGRDIASWEKHLDRLSDVYIGVA